MNAVDLDVHRRITALVNSLRDDREQSGELFQYVWTMMCVRRGLLEIVREIRAGDRTKVVVQEPGGRRRIVSRPTNFDRELEGLAIAALDRILDGGQKAS